MPELPNMSADELPCLGRLGEYQLLEKLGEGGMGTVYKALHTELDRVVALKILSPGRMNDEQAVARFKREMKAVGRLDHPNIVRAHDARDIGGTQFLVMEFVAGENLGQLSQTRGPLPVAEACELARQAAVGLQSAHEHGLIHRDIKPTNLMLTPNGQVKILDLGLARILNGPPRLEAVTVTGFTMGTPDFIAPEQVSDSHAVDARADIYSLGCTLYQLLTGQPPFTGPMYGSPFDKLRAHVSEPIPPIRRLRPEVPAGLAEILDKMLAKAPASRFATAAEVAAALSRFATNGARQALPTEAHGQATATQVSPPPILPPLAPRPAARPCVPQPTIRSRRRWRLTAGWMLGGTILAVSASLLFRDHPAREPLTDRAPAGERETGPAAPPAEPAEPTVEPGWIVMSWGRQGLGRAHLWLVSPDGQQRIPLTRDPRYFEVHPRFSPDGRRIAFVRGEPAGNANGIWACNADGNQIRQLASARDDTERLMSPVWVSDHRIYYTSDLRTSRFPEMQVWQVDLDGGLPRPVFRFLDTLHEASGLVTDASPDGRQLAVLTQREGLGDTADLCVTDLWGKRLSTVWEDPADDRKDGRALWSPDGTRIAWHHNFTAGSGSQPSPHGVGLARLGKDGQWQSQLPPDRETFVTPLAWSPASRWVLCARFASGTSRASLFLMDEQFQSVRELFDLDATCWKVNQREFARLADWAAIPPDVALPVTE